MADIPFLCQAVSFQESGEGKHDWAQRQSPGPGAFNSGTAVMYRRRTIELHAYWQAVIRSDREKNEIHLSIMAVHRSAVFYFVLIFFF